MNTEENNELDVGVMFYGRLVALWTLDILFFLPCNSLTRSRITIYIILLGEDNILRG